MSCLEVTFRPGTLMWIWGTLVCIWEEQSCQWQKLGAAELQTATNYKQKKKSAFLHAEKIEKEKEKKYKNKTRKETQQKWFTR